MRDPRKDLKIYIISKRKLFKRETYGHENLLLLRTEVLNNKKEFYRTKINYLNSIIKNYDKETDKYKIRKDRKDRAIKGLARACNEGRDL